MGFFVDRSKVLSQMIDGEYVLVNLVTGSYYSLRSTAADIWGLAAQAHEADEIARIMSQRYVVSTDALEKDIAALLQELEKEGLLCCGSQSNQLTSENTMLAAMDTCQVPYVRPVMEKFEDMQDLILLDPIHEVDEDKGWPHIKTSS